MKNIELLITDFDGTLIDTFEANCRAYQKAFEENGLTLSYGDYKRIFGLRFDEFMDEVGITDMDVKKKIREDKKRFYPNYFHLLKLNYPLLLFIKAFKNSGGLVAVASTANKTNLLNAMGHFGLNDYFDYVMAGHDVKKAKPDPEIYLSVMNHLKIAPSNTLIFEDSDIGLLAAQDSGASYIKVNTDFISTSSKNID